MAAPAADGPVEGTARYLEARAQAHVGDLEALMQRVNRLSESSEVSVVWAVGAAACGHQSLPLRQILGRSAKQFAVCEPTMLATKTVCRAAITRL